MAAALTRRTFPTAASLAFKNLKSTLPPPPKAPISPAYKTLIVTSIIIPPTRLIPTATYFNRHPISPFEDDHHSAHYSFSESENPGVFSELPQQASFGAFSELPGQASFRYEHPFLKSGNPHLFQLKNDDESARLRVEMPGIDKSGLKIWFENEMLRIEGKAKEKGDGGAEKEEEMREYDLTVEFPKEAEFLKKEEAVAEMKNGVLWIVIPKIKVEEKKNVVNVNVA